MSGILVRILIAVAVVVFVFLLLPPLLDLMGLTLTGALAQVVKLCIIGLAVLYVFAGHRWGSWPPP